MIDQLVFVGFHSRVVALDRDTGRLVWQWKSPKGSGYTTVFVDGDRVIVSVMGYTYCLVPATGEQLWSNDLKGMGTGVPSIASVRGCAQNVAGAAAEIQAESSSSAAATGSVSTPSM